jgi:hypothetical protein
MFFLVRVGFYWFLNDAERYSSIYVDDLTEHTDDYFNNRNLRNPWNPCDEEQATTDCTEYTDFFSTEI